MKGLGLGAFSVVLLLGGVPVSAGPAPFLSGAVFEQGAATASGPVQAEVTLVLGTNDGDGGVDPRIGKLPKIGDFKSYRLLSRSNVIIRRALPATTSLPNGRVLQMNLKDIKNDRYVVDTSINQPDGSTFLPLAEWRLTVDVPVFFAGQTYQGGMLIIGIKILPRQ
jgi:hypothetical protein